MTLDDYLKAAAEQSVVPCWCEMSARSGDAVVSVLKTSPAGPRLYVGICGARRSSRKVFHIGHGSYSALALLWRYRGVSQGWPTGDSNPAANATFWNGCVI